MNDVSVDRVAVLIRRVWERGLARIIDGLCHLEWVKSGCQGGSALALPMEGLDVPLFRPRDQSPDRSEVSAQQSRPHALEGSHQGTRFGVDRAEAARPRLRPVH